MNRTPRTKLDIFDMTGEDPPEEYYSDPNNSKYDYVYEEPQTENVIANPQKENRSLINEELSSKWQEIEDHVKKYHQEIYNHPLFRDVANDERYGLVPYVLYASDSQVAVVLIKDRFIKYTICPTKDIGTMNGLIFICIQNNLNDRDEKILSYLNGDVEYSAGSYETLARRNSQHR